MVIFSIGNDHRNNGFSHEKWWISPVRKGGVSRLSIAVAVITIVTNSSKL